MKEFLVFVCLLNVVVGYVEDHTQDHFNDHWSDWRGGGYGTGGIRGPFIISRDVDGQGSVEGSSPLVDEIKQLLKRANESITANELLASSNKLKALSQAWLDAQKSEISKEEIENFFEKIISQFSNVTALDLLNADALGDEAYRVSLILQMLKSCAEEIQRSEEIGEKYGHIVKVVSLLADKLVTVTENSVDLYKVVLYNSEANKGNINRRQGTWSTELIPGSNSIGGKLTYENGPFKAFGSATHDFSGGNQYEGGLQYSKGPWSAGGGVTYIPGSGVNGGLNIGYTKDNFQFGGTYDYNSNSGSTWGLGAKWTFNK